MGMSMHVLPLLGFPLRTRVRVWVRSLHWVWTRAYRRGYFGVNFSTCGHLRTPGERAVVMKWFPEGPYVRALVGPLRLYWWSRG